LSISIEIFAINGATHLPLAGAGRCIADAEAPAELPAPNDSRVLVLDLGGPDSGIPWAIS
jgi:hypothetical protein